MSAKNESGSDASQVGESNGGAHRDLTVALAAVAVAFDRFRLATARGLLGVGNTEMLALTVMAMRGPLTPSELAGEVGISNAAATSLLDRLEVENLATRNRHPRDRRKLVIELTAVGRTAIQLYLERITAVVERGVSACSPGERSALLPFLRQVAHGLAEVPDPPPFQPHVELDDRGGITAHLTGELDFASVPALGDWLDEHVSDGADSVTIDLTAVSFLSSAGIRLLVEFQHGHPGGGVRLHAPPQSPAGRALALAGLPASAPGDQHRITGRAEERPQEERPPQGRSPYPPFGE